jgi:hypothetical protein
MYYSEDNKPYCVGEIPLCVLLMDLKNLMSILCCITYPLIIGGKSFLPLSKILSFN